MLQKIGGVQLKQGTMVKSKSPLVNVTLLAFPETTLLAKKPRKHLVVLLALVLFTAMCRQSIAQAPAHSVVQQQILSNGLRVLLVEDHSFPVVSCFVWYKVGSRNESPGMTGISHLIEHMLFQSVGNYRKGELGATIVRNGGQFNGFTSDDFTAFFETVHPSKLDLMLHIESERMRKANFASQELKDELVRINQDIEEQARDPQATLAREVRSTAFAQHPYRNPAIGYKTDLDSLTVQDVRSFYDRYYYPDNATLVVVGDINTPAVSAAIAKYFANLPKSPNPIPVVRAVEPPQKAERRVIMHQPGKRDVVEVAYHAPAFADADAPAVVVMEKMLNAQYSGRLKKLVESKAAVSAKSVYELKKDPGLFTLSFSIAPGSLQKLLEVWDGTINQIKTQGAAEPELRRAKNLAEYAYDSENDGPYHAAFNLGFCDSLHSWQLAETWPDKLKAVTNADIQRVAKRYFTHENRVVGLLATPIPPPKLTTPPTNPPGKPPTKPAPSADSEPDQQQHKPHAKPFDHVHLTGYKQDDASLPRAVAQSTTSQVSTPLNGALQSPASPRAETTTATGRSGNQNGATSPADEPPKPGGEALKPAAKPLMLEASPSHVQERVLKNGLMVLVLESHLAPIVQIVGVVRAGTAFEPPNKKGISDVIAACMNNGSTKYTHAQLQQAQEDLGMPPAAMLHFESGLQAINFKTRCLARDLSAVLNFIGTSLRDPLVQAPELDRAKQDVLAQFKQIEESSIVKTERALLRSLIAPNSPYYPDDLNQKATSIATFKPAELDDYHGENVLPEATTIVIVGDVSAEVAFRLAEQAFGSWEQNTSTAKNFPPVQSNPRRVVKTSIPIKDKTKTFVSIGRLVSAPAETSNYAYLMLADCVLTNHPIFSRLAQRFGAEPTLADNLSPDAIDSRFVPLGNTIAWSLNIPVEPNIVSTMATTVQSELKKFARTGVTPEEFAEVKRFLVNAVPVRQFSSTTDAAKTILECFVQSSGHNGFNEEVANMRAAKLENLNKFVRNDLKPDQSSLVIAGTTSNMKRVHGGKANGPAEPREVTPVRDSRGFAPEATNSQNKKFD